MEVTASNNYQTKVVAVPKEVSFKQDPELISYVFERGKFKHYQEPQLFIEVMDWVASQWQHDGFNEAPSGMSSLDILKSVHQQGTRYRCVEYGKVMADILSAMGHHSRQIGLQSSDVAYGGWGKGHVATEVWSNDLNKWIFFDPQFSTYAQYEGQYLNIYDMFLLKQQGKYEQISFIVTSSFAKLNDIKQQENQAGYSNFLSNYFGYHIASQQISDKKQSTVLMMEAKEPFLTFQGMGSNNTKLFTKAVEIAYPKMNQTLFSMSALPNESASFQSVIQKNKIETEEQYLENMWRFAAQGKVAMFFYNNMQQFSHYEIKTNHSAWLDHQSEEFTWELQRGVNRFEVRSISKEGVLGPITFVEVNYQ
ncbi:hypothetical protein TUM4433_06020 [Shewanella schlegeliana]|nr:hypothetical protein TUM4433_06020 [Shewanella schlegeliana]